MLLPTLLMLSQIQTSKAPDFLKWSAKPPMGWNSWDCFGTTVTEDQYKANVDYMAEKLKKFGWQYAVVDIQWYEPNAKGFEYDPKAILVMDGFGRLQPAENRFPSAKDGKGFKPLADYVHKKGLKFGIHLMRGIPRQAVEKNLPIFGTNFKASEIADRENVCTWNPDMYGVDMTKAGAQAYYDSVFQEIASWGVDFVKVDDLSRPYHQNEPEIQAIRKAIDKTKRPMVLSLSPGETPLDAWLHVSQHANMWRISDDFWDSWPALKEQFARLSNWNKHKMPGAYPDADMLPIGTLAHGTRKTNFTRDEQYTLMSLWAIAKSPLMIGADMTKMDPFTESLLTNEEVINLNQTSIENRPFYDENGIVAWVAANPKTKDRYVAVFNSQDPFDLSRGELLSDTRVITRDTDGQGEKVIANVEGFETIALVFGDAKDGNSWDHGVWLNPIVELANGTSLHLARDKWKFSFAGYGEVTTSKAPGNQPLSVAGIKIQDGIFAHAPSIVVFDVPSDSVAFTSFAALNDSAMKETTGGTIQPFIFGFKKGGPHEKKSLVMNFDLSSAGAKGGSKITDLWTGETKVLESSTTILDIPWHGCKLLKISN